MYYVNDGIYGTFRVKRNPHGPPKWISSSTTPLTTATVWGPTCCSDDKVIDDVSLPELNIGDWLYFENSGAYSYAVCSEFNGFFRPQSLYYVAKSDFAQLQDQVSFSRKWFNTKTQTGLVLLDRNDIDHQCIDELAVWLWLTSKGKSVHCFW